MNEVGIRVLNARTQSSHPFSEHLFIHSQGIHLAAFGALIHPLAFRALIRFPSSHLTIEHSFEQSQSIDSSILRAFILLSENSFIQSIYRFIYTEHS